jgi:hypothetical protein
LPYAVDVHFVATDVNELAGHGMGAAVASSASGLIGDPGDGQHNYSCCDEDDYAVQQADRLRCWGRR